jgi:hypothetical protein
MKRRLGRLVIPHKAYTENLGLIHSFLKELTCYYNYYDVLTGNMIFVCQYKKFREVDINSNEMFSLPLYCYGLDKDNEFLVKELDL